MISLLFSRRGYERNFWERGRSHFLLGSDNRGMLKRQKRKSLKKKWPSKAELEAAEGTDDLCFIFPPSQKPEQIHKDGRRKWRSRWRGEHGGTFQRERKGGRVQGGRSQVSQDGEKKKAHSRNDRAKKKKQPAALTARTTRVSRTRRPFFIFQVTVATKLQTESRAG